MLFMRVVYLREQSMATLLEQSIAAQKQEIAQLQQQQANLEQSSSQLFAQYRDARSALNAAKADPNTPAATLNQLQRTFDNVAAQRETANDNLESVSSRLERLQSALASNERQLANPANNTGLATQENTTSDPGQDAQINRQATAQAEASTGAIPAGSSATPTPPPVPTEEPLPGGNDDDPFGLDEPPDVTEEPLPAGNVDDFSEFDGMEAPPPVSNEELGIDPELEAEQLAQEEAIAAAQTESINTNQGIPGKTNNARAQATLQDTTNFQQKKDWRVRLSLSPGATYLYKDSTNTLLAPLNKTDGIIFPYTPTINVTYGANYQSVAPVHSNYKIFQYENSFVDTVTITCDFTAQDTSEANYVLAVIHFLRSVTKMFYGQDENPKPGTPPPLCYLFGLGEFQFNAHPLAITNFTYNLPSDVDYIRAGALTLPPGSNRSEQADTGKANSWNPLESAVNALAQGAISKLGGTAKSIVNQLMPGGGIAGPNFSTLNRGFNSSVPPGTKEPTYVPTKINISISAIPIVSRYEVSSNFSVKDYASGKLLNGVKRAGGGFW